MPEAPRKQISSAPFPFVRQFTTPPFFVGKEDARFRSQLLLDAVQQTGTKTKKAPAGRKAVKKGKRKVTPAKKSGPVEKRRA